MMTPDNVELFADGSSRITHDGETYFIDSPIEDVLFESQDHQRSYAIQTWREDELRSALWSAPNPRTYATRAERKARRRLANELHEAMNEVHQERQKTLDRARALAGEKRLAEREGRAAQWLSDAAKLVGGERHDGA